MEKYIELNKGTFERNGKEYDYIVEIPKCSLKKRTGNMRLRIIEERPVIHKIRTRYDPDIQVFGDKDASMELLLGYDLKEINKALKYFLFTLLSPFYVVGIFILISKWDEMPIHFLPYWTLFLMVPLLVVLGIILLKQYYRMNMIMLAEYLKSRDLKKILRNEGFKQDE